MLRYVPVRDVIRSTMITAYIYAMRFMYICVCDIYLLDFICISRIPMYCHKMFTNRRYTHCTASHTHLCALCGWMDAMDAWCGWPPAVTTTMFIQFEMKYLYEYCTYDTCTMCMLNVNGSNIVAFYYNFENVLDQYWALGNYGIDLFAPKYSI